MAFSSIPAYLDPSNWQQQQNHQIIIGSSSSGGANPLLVAPPHGGHTASGVGSNRAGSMAERARMANIAVPEAALKCPRCESTNTKFCYFNNYSLTQPRHFCKTCRRYWTRGGALRNVPVGGGCRRNNNKRSSKSSADRAHQPNNNNNNNNKNPNSSTSSADPTTAAGSAATAAANMGLGLPPLRFMGFNEGFAGEHVGMGGYGGGMAEEMGFHGGAEPWRMQQFPFPGGLQEQSAAAGNINYQFGGGGGGGGESMLSHQKLSSSMLSQHASIKMEERTAARNLSRQLLLGNILPNEEWNNNNNINNNNSNTVNWTDLSNFSPSSTGNNL